MTQVKGRKGHSKSVLVSDAALLPAAGLAIHPAARPAFEAWLTAWPALSAGSSTPAAVVSAAWWGEEARIVAGFAAYAHVIAGSREAVAVVQPLSEAEIARIAWAEVDALLAAAGLPPAVVIRLRERARLDTGNGSPLTPALRRKLARQPGPQPAPRPFARAIARYRASRP